MRTCEVPDCGRPHKARGYCVAHYMRVREGGDLRPEVPVGAERVCVVDGCGRKHYGGGWCRAHHERQRRSGSVQADVPIARPRIRTTYRSDRQSRDQVRPRRVFDLDDTGEL